MRPESHAPTLKVEDTSPQSLYSEFLHGECDEPLFRPTYKRNNKACGQKNLRCFPHCCRQHNKYGFCGVSVQVGCRHPTLTSDDPSNPLVCYARFEVVPKNKGDKLVELMTNVKEINIGDTLQVRDIESQTKVNAPGEAGGKNTEGKGILGPWMKAVPFATRRNVFMVNGNRQSWHYGWVASPFVPSEMTHRLAIYFFKLNHPQGTLECVDHIYSPSFRVMSSRRKYPKGAKGKKVKSQSKNNVKEEPRAVPPRANMAPLVDPAASLNSGMNRNMSLKDVLNTAYGSLPSSPKSRKSFVTTPTSATVLTSDRKRSLDSLDTAPCEKKVRRNSISKQTSFANLYADNPALLRNIIPEQGSGSEVDPVKSKRKDSEEIQLHKFQSFNDLGGLASNGSFSLSSNGSFILSSNGSFKDGFDINAYKDYDVFASGNEEPMPGIDWKLLESTGSNGSFVFRPVQNSPNV